MSGGWWYGDDGSRYWLDEPAAVQPISESPPVIPMAPEPPKSDPEPWRPSGAPLEPIVAFSRDVLGLDLWTAQAALLSELYRDRVRTGVLRLGRRSGKGRMASVLAIYEATVNAAAHLAAVPKGEHVTIVVVATSRRQARIIHRYCAGYFSRSALAARLVRESDDELELDNGVVIVTMPCSARSSRGEAVAVAIFDEAAWFVDSDGSPVSGEGLWHALVPATAQFPAGRVLVLSTPRWSTGWFADLCRLADSGSHADMRHWWATTEMMNPTISAAFLETERSKDPAAFRREYEARFDSGVGAVFDEASVRAAITKWPMHRLHTASYVLAIDAAFVGDTFAAAVGRRDGERVVVERIAGWRGSQANPLNHRETLDAIAALATEYNHASVLLDQFAAEPIAQGLAERGLSPLRRPWTNESKLDATTLLRQLLYQQRIDLPNHSKLVAELVQLESTPLPSGRVRIAAPPGGHDDYATALLALANELAGKTSAVSFASMIA